MFPERRGKLHEFSNILLTLFSPLNQIDIELAAIISEQKKKLSGLLDRNGLALGEIIYNNVECQILS